VNAKRFAALLAVLLMAPPALAVDPLFAERSISESPSSSLLPAPCVSGTPTIPLGLAEAVSRALCYNPKTRDAWANVKVQAAAVGAARAAFLPTLSANWQGVRDDSQIDVAGHPDLSSKTDATIRSAGGSLNWVLFDFGARSAALRNANELLVAARATQDATLQETFATVVKDYDATQAAQAVFDEAREVEHMTADCVSVAQKRVDHGAAPISDVLQAQTQHEQAVAALTKSEGALRTVLGVLASDMGLRPDEPLTVPSVLASPKPDHAWQESVSDMISEVRSTHPAVLAAEAQYEAARAKVVQARAEGLPTVSLVAKYGTNNQPASLGLGIPTYPATGHDAYIGIQVNFPFFEGFGRHYQIHQVEAQAEREQVAMDGTRDQVALDVWKAWQTMQTATASVEQNGKLLAIAERAFEAAQHRYKASVGDILELLNTQTALANAKLRRIQALTDWHDARIELAAKLGQLGMTDVQ
jgi:outer membrane protein